MAHGWLSRRSAVSLRVRALRNMLHLASITRRGHKMTIRRAVLQTSRSSHEQDPVLS